MTLPAPSPLDDLDAALVDLEDSRARRPLAWWRAWHREEPGRTSQRSALSLLELVRILLILGGNRTGKTELMRAALVALALGSDHPDARAFWLSNGLDPDLFPAGPDRVWIVALTSSDSLRYHRQQVLDLVPKWGPRHPSSQGEGAPYHTWQMDSRGEGRIDIMCPGYSKPAQIYFKSEDQGADAMQGDRCRAILHDEEGKTSKTWDEADVRLWDLNGWHIMTNTPVNGRTWVWDRFVREPPPHDQARVYWLHSRDNPYIEKSRLARMESGDPLVVAARTRGEFVALTGRQWPEFSRAVHVLPADTPIPADAVRFRSIDFGTRHPFACLWGAYLKRAITLPNGRRIPDGSLVVYREHYRKEWTTPQHVEVIRRSEGWVREAEAPEGVPLEREGWVRDGVEGWVRPRGTGEAIEASWADPEDPQQVLQLNREHELMVVKARKAVKAGLDAVAEELHPDATGEPRLFVLESCPNAIREWEGYLLSERGEKSEGGVVDAPVSRDDHTCDCVRYMVMGVRAWRG